MNLGRDPTGFERNQALSGTAVGGDCPELSLRACSDHEEPVLVQGEHRFDRAHGNQAGASLFSEHLARDFAGLSARTEGG